VVAQFSGTGVSARFDTSLNQAPIPTLAWRIDQGPWQEGELAATVMLGTGLSPGMHEVMVMVRGFNEYQSRWIPPLISSVTFLGLDATGGALQPSPRPVRPKMEILGDSITEGLYIWTSHNGQTTVPWRAEAWAPNGAKSGSAARVSPKAAAATCRPRTTPSIGSRRRPPPSRPPFTRCRCCKQRASGPNSSSSASGRKPPAYGLALGVPAKCQLPCTTDWA
jgi:hypothetical protein